MKKEAASRTAQYMALFRAIESARPEGDRIFYDPYAVSFLDSSLKLVTKLSATSLGKGLIQKYLQQRIPGAFSSGIARTKYIDNLLKRAIDSGAKRLIILGAGFDTRGLRLDFMKDIPVIEIDHPNTAQLKIDTLKSILGKLPQHIKYYQIDFNTQSLDKMAEERNLDFSIPTVIIWEGVTNYLSHEAVNATFRFIEKFEGNSSVIFTYVNQQVLDAPATYFGGEKLLRDLTDIEERWTFGLRPEAVSDFLRNFNLTLLEDKGAADYRAQYLPTRQQPGYEFYRVAFAEKG